MLTIEELVEGEYYNCEDYHESYLFYLKNGNLKMINSKDSLDCYFTGNWKRFKSLRFTPYRQSYVPSEQEIQLFKLLPEWVKWIAVDKCGDVCVYEIEPEKGEKIYYDVGISKHKFLSLFNHIIKLTFDDGAFNIEQYKGDK
jgi:hypothetical protein